MFKYEALEKTFTAESFFQRDFSQEFCFYCWKVRLDYGTLGSAALKSASSIVPSHRHAVGSSWRQALTNMQQKCAHENRGREMSVLIGSLQGLGGVPVLCLLPAGRVGLGTLVLRGLEASGCGHECSFVSWPLGLCWWAPLSSLTVFMGDINNKWVSHSATNCSVVGHLECNGSTFSRYFGWV